MPRVNLNLFEEVMYVFSAGSLWPDCIHLTRAFVGIGKNYFFTIFKRFLFTCSYMMFNDFQMMYSKNQQQDPDLLDPVIGIFY